MMYVLSSVKVIRHDFWIFPSGSFGSFWSVAGESQCCGDWEGGGRGEKGQLSRNFLQNQQVKLGSNPVQTLKQKVQKLKDRARSRLSASLQVFVYLPDLTITGCQNPPSPSPVAREVLIQQVY
jgi:hypothetical protein